MLRTNVIKISEKYFRPFGGFMTPHYWRVRRWPPANQRFFEHFQNTSCCIPFDAIFYSCLQHSRLQKPKNLQQKIYGSVKGSHMLGNSKSGLEFNFLILKKYWYSKYKFLSLAPAVWGFMHHYPMY